MWIVPPVAGLIEQVPAIVISNAHIGAIAFDGYVASIYYYTERPHLDGGGSDKSLQAIVERTPESLARGQPMIFELIQRLLTAERPEQGWRPPSGFNPHLVR